MRLYKNNYAVLYRRTSVSDLSTIPFYIVTSVSRSADRTLICALLRSSVIRFPIIVRRIDPNARTRVFRYYTQFAGCILRLET